MKQFVGISSRLKCTGGKRQRLGTRCFPHFIAKRSDRRELHLLGLWHGNLTIE